MRKFILILLTIFTQACAFTDATLPVQHDSNANTVGPISEVEILTFSPPNLEDARSDKQRIGWKKNGYGQHTADITTEKTVQVIIEDAVTDALLDNGHAVVEDASITITGSIDRFWFETDMNFWTVEFIGDIQCTLDFKDASTSETIYSSVYTGTYKREVAGGLEATWTEVMAEAVDNLIEEIVFDDALAEALEEYRQ
ncbi:Uncharacterised protein [Halioglobus japonicus]|nr:Uncharacterised protein [Halioglobus japonicus]